MSESHVSDCHSITEVCKQAGIQQIAVTATKMQHLLSTLYVALDIQESKHHAFY